MMITLEKQTLCGLKPCQLFGLGSIFYPNLASSALFPHLPTERSSAWTPELGSVTGTVLNLGLKSQLMLTLRKDSEAKF